MVSPALLSTFFLPSQSVSIDDSTTNPSPVLTGIPQGSVLGPLLFSLYTSPLSAIFSSTSVKFHLYADDTQLYISLSPSDPEPNLSALSTTLDSSSLAHFEQTHR